MFETLFTHYIYYYIYLIFLQVYYVMWRKLCPAVGIDFSKGFFYFKKPFCYSSNHILTDLTSGYKLKRLL